MIVFKAINMARIMNIPILGLVENMSYVLCPECGKELTIFGENRIEEIAAKFNIDILARIPFNPKLCNKGMSEMIESNYMDSAITILENKTVKNVPFNKSQFCF